MNMPEGLSPVVIVNMNANKHQEFEVNNDGDIIQAAETISEENTVVDSSIDSKASAVGSSSGNSGGGGWFDGWFGPSKEQRRAKKEFEKWQKSFNEKNPDSPVSLPPAFLPSAWACLALFATLTFHALFFLLGHWIVEFKALTLYHPAKQVEEDAVVLVVPQANRGKAAIVDIKTIHSSNTLQIEFQRQNYVYTPASSLGADGALYPNGVFELISCPVNEKLTVYVRSKGLESETEVERQSQLWGRNHLQVTIPSFLELLQLQLLSPLAIFQVFCALLWLLDEYWIQTMWTLVSVVIFEATTVFQRSRTQKMLGGMAPIPSPIYVYRGGAWTVVTTKDILPKDIISVSTKKQPKNESTPAAPQPAQKDESIPCDCLILRGSAVVNESSLTGESIPQMKEAVVVNNTNEDTSLDMNGTHRVHILFSGTTIVTIDRNDHDVVSRCTIPNPPDNGLIAYVLRTGFSSSQGNLMQMIEFSQQAVTGDSKETGLALLLLFIFALIAAGYVLKEGLRKKEKTTHEILLKCVIIITSVVPRQFPMQMAMAVNMALMSLFKNGIFCTEPFRVPLAGKISNCLFDKTGTLTTDQQVPVGVINASKPLLNKEKEVELSLVSDADGFTAIILAACHSLVVVDEGKSNEAGNTNDNAAVVGDPIEVAAIKGVEWGWNAASSTAYPGATIPLLAKARDILNKELHDLITRPANNPAVPAIMMQQEKTQIEKRVEAKRKQIEAVEKNITLSENRLKKAMYKEVQVLHRHHFSSQLQRMSVVCKCRDGSSKEDYYGLVKGSPEAILRLLKPSAIPVGYRECYESLARKGLRVLALAYKKLSVADRPDTQPREWLECELELAGFVAFECKIRGDSKVVVGALLDSDHKVAMLTGDALLTSQHVAKEVGICDKHKDTLTLHAAKDGVYSPHWMLYKSQNRDESEENKTVEVAFDIGNIDTLAAKYDMVTTEKDLLEIIDKTGEKESLLWRKIGYFKVFARMSPQGKADIIKNIQLNSLEKEKAFVLMCGDGGNDVGALKQADVGMALLAGHANANTTESVDVNDKAAAVDSNLSSEDALNKHDQELKKRNDAFNNARNAHMKAFHATITKELTAKMQEEVSKRVQNGDYWSMWEVTKQNAQRIKELTAAENQRYCALHGQLWDPKKDALGDGAAGTSVDSLMAQLDGADSGMSGGMPIVRPGDASVAAPFTSRVPSIRAVVDLIRQGRCTLLSALMQQQIMMLESIIAAYTLSSLSLHNARSSERQMIASSWLIMTAAVSFSYSSPLDHMHPLRPLRSLFHPAIIFSIFGQAIIHIACMSLAVKWATDEMGPDTLKEVTEFFRKARAKEIDTASLCEEDDVFCQFNAFWSAPFMPNLLNSVVFLVETSQMISVFFANYKGRPWMKVLTHLLTYLLTYLLTHSLTSCRECLKTTPCFYLSSAALRG